MTKKSLKEVMSENSLESYKLLRQHYINVLNNVYSNKTVTKSGEVVDLGTSVAEMNQAAAGLQRLDIDKLQGSAKSRESDSDKQVNSDVLKQLEELAAAKEKNKTKAAK